MQKQFLTLPKKFRDIKLFLEDIRRAGHGFPLSYALKRMAREYLNAPKEEKDRYLHVFRMLLLVKLVIECYTESMASKNTRQAKEYYSMLKDLKIL